MQEISANQQFSIPKMCKRGLKEEKREEAIDRSQIQRPSGIKGTHKAAQRLVAHVCTDTLLCISSTPTLPGPDIGGYRSAGRVPREPEELPLQTTPTSSSHATSGT